MVDIIENKLIIGFITYGKATAKYLPYFLSSLRNQTYRDFKILAIDNTEVENNENADFIKKNYPEIEFGWAGENLGFAGAYNKMIEKAVKYGAQYFLMLNPDVLLDVATIEIMITALDNENQLASVCPKILRLDFKNNKKTNIIDTMGVKLLPGLRFIDLGQGKVDKGQYNNTEVLGPSGAAGLYRISALLEVAPDRKYFDELMFMYKEDCDLAYRLYLAGFKSKLASEAVIYHDRTISGKGESDLEVALNRKNKSRLAKEWSLKNQLIIFYKYWPRQIFKNKILIIWRLVKIVGFIIVSEQYLIKTVSEFYKIKNKINQFKSV